MDFEKFQESLKQNHPPQGLGDPLKALWWDGKGNWKKAHETAQDVSNADGAWVHAYLHRKEGEEWNAQYWYGQASRPKISGSLAKEWEDMSRELLS